MTHSPENQDFIESLPKVTFTGTVFRFTSGDVPPIKENTYGARWNPPQVGAIYTCLERETAIAEFEHLTAIQSPRRSKGRFYLYSIQVVIESVVDFVQSETWARLGVQPEALAGDSFTTCQAIGGAAHWLQIGGILVPSARRRTGRNLVIYPEHQGKAFEFEPIDKEPLK